jgi:hypothetical protein
MKTVVTRRSRPALNVTERQRWAGVRPHLTWKRPSLPAHWMRVLERNPEVLNPDSLPGYVWLATLGKVLHGDERRLAFADDPPEAS